MNGVSSIARQACQNLGGVFSDLPIVGQIHKVLYRAGRDRQSGSQSQSHGGRREIFPGDSYRKKAVSGRSRTPLKNFGVVVKSCDIRAKSCPANEARVLLDNRIPKAAS
jgi:hypothetical protein